MGIYSNVFIESNESEIESYIENSFLNSCYDEKTFELREAVRNIDSLESYSNIVKNITESSLSDLAKYNLLTEATESITNIQESVLLEFKGNDQKNKEFIEILKEVEELMTFFLERIKRLSSDMEKMLGYTETILKKPNTFKTNLDKCRDDIKEFNEWYEKSSKSINGSVTWNKFKSKIGKFNNKYSEITMEEKKKLNSKLEKYRDEMKKVALPWINGTEIDKVIENLKKLDKIDPDYTKSITGYIASAQKYLIDECKYTDSDMYYVQNKLNIKSENGILYKVVNKLLK